MASRWNRRWLNAKTQDKDIGQPSPYNKLSPSKNGTTNLGTAACRAEGATKTTGGQFRESDRKVHQK